MLTASITPALDRKNRDDIFDEVARVISGEFRTEILRAPTDGDREAVRMRVSQLVSAAVRRRSLSGVVYEVEQKLAADIARFVLVEFKEGKLPEGPPEAVKIARKQLIELVSLAGLSLESEKADLLPYQVFLVFRKGT